MSRPLWFVNLIKQAFPVRFLAAKATRFPVIGKIMDHLLFEGDDLFYLPKDHTIQIYEPIQRSIDVVLPSQIVEHFIEQSNYHWIMNTCICRESNHCQDYPIDYGCLFLGEASMGINPALGRRVNKAQAIEHVRRCREAGLVHMIGRNKLDTVWLGVSPGEKLLTICNCCPCCCLWKVLPHVDRIIAGKVNKLPGVSVTVSNLCNACGLCTQGICFVDAIHLEGDIATINDDCRGCGRCADVCPNGAITLAIEIPGYHQLTIERISASVDLK